MTMETIAKINYNSEVFRIEGDVWERGRMGEGAHGGQNWTRRHGDAGTREKTYSVIPEINAGSGIIRNPRVKSGSCKIGKS